MGKLFGPEEAADCLRDLREGLGELVRRDPSFGQFRFSPTPRPWQFAQDSSGVDPPGRYPREHDEQRRLPFLEIPQHDDPRGNFTREAIGELTATFLP